jgi:hypothetical protein
MAYHEDESVEMLEQETGCGEEEARPVGARLAGFKDRISGALAGLDRGRLDQLGLDSGAHLDGVHDVVGELHGEYEYDDEPGGETEYLDPVEPESEDGAGDGHSFPVGRLGYNRAAVDARIAELEAELAELRAIPPQPSISEELERLGEQTASILVVAHDQASQTTRDADEKAKEMTRLAQEQADRCIADAAANAVAMTEKAKRQLRKLDDETDGVWRERARLLEDAHHVGQALITMTEEALERFPADPKSDGTQVQTPAPGFPPPVAGGGF